MPSVSREGLCKVLVECMSRRIPCVASDVGGMPELIEDGKTVVASPHKVYGPETNDLVLQLRKRGIDRVILGGMSANLCTESHLRELLEQGFQVAVVTDATAAAQTPDIDGYAAALTNFRFLANANWSTAQATSNIKAASNAVASAE